jgi:PEGA domain
MRSIPCAVILATVLSCVALASTANAQQATSSAQDVKGNEASPPAHKTRVVLGTVSEGGFYSHSPWSGFGYPAGYPCAPFFWDPYCGFYGPFYAPGYFTGFPPGEDKGQVKLHVVPQNAEVFLDGAYAGTADRLKSMWLKPGAYDLTVKAEHRAPFHQRIYILTNKTLNITTALILEKEDVKP